MTVLLIGRVFGHEFELLREEIERRGSDVVVVDVDDWPSGKAITHDVSDESIRLGSESLSIEEVEGAFVKPLTIFNAAVEDRLNGVVSDDENPYSALTQLREYRGIFKSILRSLESHGATVAPNVETFVWDEITPHAYDRFRAAGIDVPETLATVDSAAAKEFLADHGKVVYKPITEFGGAYVLTEDESEEVEDLTTPVMFQEFVPGDDVRAYVVDGEYVGQFRYVYDGGSFSYKYPEGEVGAEPVEIPDAAREDVLAAADVLPTTYSAVDLRLDDDGSHSIMEVNSGGRFMLADSEGVTNVAEALADHLVG